VLLGNARLLQRAALAGATRPLLRGKNLGLLGRADADAARLFRRAAEELGARVAEIGPGLAEDLAAPALQHTARMLGRLYDAVECEGMAHALVEQVGRDAGVPVFDGIACEAHPTARLADELGTDSPAADRRRFVLQAVLLATIG
jgi:ornithine carbamoyltransferase